MSMIKLATGLAVVTGTIFATGPEIGNRLLPEPSVIRIPYEKPVEQYQDLVKEIAPKYGVPIEIVGVLWDKEHDGSRYPYRFEPSQMGRGAKFSRNESQQRLYASSFCPLQVMGYNVAETEHPLDLLQPRTCVETSMRIMAGCLERHAGKPRSEQYWLAFKCYNGGDEYARDAMHKLTDILLARLQ